MQCCRVACRAEVIARCTREDIAMILDAVAFAAAVVVVLAVIGGIV
jgi:hypothetical protein